ncbi:hypothetical protein FNV43_RR16494 [Rhamnella rubrinervis]|uniref:Uncharacterized protein n=1 Tax=Rhamnella rubrinervis TaxID=2594499 RepID=A0A8K0GYV9_9ROSA|nr:hypothetical protein FNV43_RR16494 [Rhamnella rubrinervis]
MPLQYSWSTLEEEKKLRDSYSRDVDLVQSISNSLLNDVQLHGQVGEISDHLRKRLIRSLNFLTEIAEIKNNILKVSGFIEDVQKIQVVQQLGFISNALGQRNLFFQSLLQAKVIIEVSIEKDLLKFLDEDIKSLCAIRLIYPHLNEEISELCSHLRGGFKEDMVTIDQIRGLQKENQKLILTLVGLVSQIPVTEIPRQVNEFLEGEMAKSHPQPQGDNGLIHIQNAQHLHLMDELQVAHGLGMGTLLPNAGIQNAQALLHGQDQQAANDGQDQQAANDGQDQQAANDGQDQQAANDGHDQQAANDGQNQQAPDAESEVGSNLSGPANTRYTI